MNSFSTASSILIFASVVGACTSTDHSVGSHEDFLDGSNPLPDGGNGDGATNQVADGGPGTDAGPNTCNGVKNPAGCSAENPCGTDEDCVPNDGNTCISSGCACESSSKTWTCLPDCGGNVCVPKGTTCNGVKNPAGCSNENPCPSGKTCQPNDTAACISSGCACDSSSKTWNCLPDCGGQICK